MAHFEDTQIVIQPDDGEVKCHTKHVNGAVYAVFMRLHEDEGAVRSQATAEGQAGQFAEEALAIFGVKGRGQRAAAVFDLYDFHGISARGARDLGSIDGARRFPALEHFVHPVNKLLQAEGLGNVIIDLGNVQAKHLIDVLGLGGHHDHGDILSALIRL